MVFWGHNEEIKLRPWKNLGISPSLMYTRAAQNILGLNFQTPTLSLAQNPNAYQVLGPKVNVLRHPQRPKETLLTS